MQINLSEVKKEKGKKNEGNLYFNLFKMQIKRAERHRHDESGSFGDDGNKEMLTLRLR